MLMPLGLVMPVSAGLTSLVLGLMREERGWGAGARAERRRVIVSTNDSCRVFMGFPGLTKCWNECCDERSAVQSLLWKDVADDERKAGERWLVGDCIDGRKELG